jgi:hypothetical protein
MTIAFSYLFALKHTVSINMYKIIVIYFSFFVNRWYRPQFTGETAV